MMGTIDIDSLLSFPVPRPCISISAVSCCELPIAAGLRQTLPPMTMYTFPTKIRIVGYLMIKYNSGECDSRLSTVRNSQTRTAGSQRPSGAHQRRVWMCPTNKNAQINDEYHRKSLCIICGFVDRRSGEIVNEVGRNGMLCAFRFTQRVCCGLNRALEPNASSWLLAPSQVPGRPQ
jgi:hypothetical protein